LAGVLKGIVNTVNSVGGFLSPLLVELLISGQVTLWLYVQFWIPWYWPRMWINFLQPSLAVSTDGKPDGST